MKSTLWRAAWLALAVAACGGKVNFDPDGQGSGASSNGGGPQGVGTGVGAASTSAGATTSSSSVSVGAGGSGGAGAAAASCDAACQAFDEKGCAQTGCAAACKANARGPCADALEAWLDCIVAPSEACSGPPECLEVYAQYSECANLPVPFSFCEGPDYEGTLPTGNCTSLVVCDGHVGVENCFCDGQSSECHCECLYDGELIGTCSEFADEDGTTVESCSASGSCCEFILPW